MCSSGISYYIVVLVFINLWYDANVTLVNNWVLTPIMMWFSVLEFRHQLWMRPGTQFTATFKLISHTYNIISQIVFNIKHFGPTLLWCSLSFSHFYDVFWTFLHTKYITRDLKLADEKSVSCLFQSVHMYWDLFLVQSVIWWSENIAIPHTYTEDQFNQCYYCYTQLQHGFNPGIYL